ncbi:ATP-binding cassette domain-containing protein [Atopobium sp. oral taxon 416]|uniref:ATP-binding cassette domain-containing protein n=1 Tax=Atopobium sp. oral taxon 416 TaxID=712157 RepID=UPI001BA8BA8C|nr:ABC transporter ATP-binding protein [Atopobium sp. oral taxon 416]QUC04284.1 ABC transporter ATP-binding protein [Atopobium sp. oral taxon 416]
MELVKFDLVNKDIDGKRILQDISFSIRTGEIIGLIGPNGAGKTTTMRLVSGIYRPTSGHISRTYKESGVVLDRDGMYENLTMREQLNYISLLKTGKTITDEEYNTITNTIALDTGSKRISKFSKGMKRRLSIGCLLISKPDLILLDEPFIGLDPQGQKSMQKLLKELSKSSSLFISSHNLDLLEGVINKVILINKTILLEKEAVNGESLKPMYFKVFEDINIEKE